MIRESNHLLDLIDITKRLKLEPLPDLSRKSSGRQYMATRRGYRKISSGTMLCDLTECRAQEGSSEKDHVFKEMSMSDKLKYVHDSRKEIAVKDQELSKQLLHIYVQIRQMKVQQSCMYHQDLLDDVFRDISDEKELPDVCDLPVRKRNKALQQLGVTRMNIHSKRFSCS
ncbi:protein FAM167A-like [Ylistrum balloti]|uniref:protein FAM167A-like n=1 Tax=Ylistrum balloti TaxID=509963 RepID=UPI002905AFDE|nr:protein FAM167A-like [Ylistrum balloti]